MKWVKPFITCFLPQAGRISTSTTTVVSYKTVAEEVASNNATVFSDPSATTTAAVPVTDPWKRKTMVESDGNYLGETFLEESLPLYSNQDDLPLLPVPSIEETMDRFLPTAVPLAETHEEVSTLKEACEAFKSQAQILQERLKARFHECSQDPTKTSWLQEFWQKDGYLKVRDPVNFFVSYFFLMPQQNSDQPPPLWESSSSVGIVKAAALCRAASDYAEPIALGTKEPDVVGKKKIPQCSTSYKYMFHACRIPKVGQDTVRLYNPRLHTHAVVACRGRFFEIPLKDQRGVPLSRTELEILMTKCTEEAANNAPQQQVLELGWFTSWNRDDWAKARELLIKRGGPLMTKALERIESSLFVINLDIDSNAETLQEQGENFYHGGMSSGGNRWWDKSIQIAVTQTGKWNFLGEHSMVDGLVPVDFCEHLLSKGTFDPHDDYVANVPEELLTPGPHPIDIFQQAVDNLSKDDLDYIQERIDLAKADFSKLMQDITYHNEHFKGYGSDFIKKSGASADAYAQMAIQLAAYRLFGGKQVGTYESTTVRPFLHGRTEATRTVSPASLEFCKAMGMECNLNRDIETRRTILKLLQKAAFGHVKYTKKATMGLGVDRHFFGLSKMLKKDEQAPDLFQDPLFVRSKTWRLSTSTLPTCPGFGMVVDNGIGIGYCVYENDMVFNIAARTEHDYSKNFGRLLSEALEEIKALIVL